MRAENTEVRRMKKLRLKGHRMKRYEMAREIFNNCAGNQMRDVFFEEVATDDPEAFVREMCKGKEVEIERSQKGNDVIFDVVIAGLRQRFSFTLIE